MQVTLYKVLVKQGSKYFILGELAQTQQQAEELAQGMNADLVQLVEELIVEIPE